MEYGDCQIGALVLMADGQQIILGNGELFQTAQMLPAQHHDVA